MDKNHKITIPKPCHENWDKMNPKDNGRFCLSCTKTVVDFTTMLPEEVQHYFISNQNKSICGRFKSEQLDERIIQIPSQVLYSQAHYHKMFLLALFITMGTTLFSCQDKNGEKQKINKVEIVPEEQQGFSTGEPRLRRDPNSYNNTVDYDGIKNQGELDVVAHPEIGITKFYEFIQKNYKIPYTSERPIGSVYVSFVVEKDGSLNNIIIQRDFGYGSGKEAIRVLKMSPKWVSGKINNHNVRSVYNMPIRFNY
ncbi:energy transducer TonB [Flavobacterium sp. MC2016-06]|jgi:hypothetical protein|uniref:energy transducer TonB n=1 Tax=Flavobacterium sp. MC2016-06 TaxID=2676308 RepID=UPI0018ACC3FE|nr:energy transducer TonB [Flavobacterium sp. MC2016-06]MBU3858085.1 energy transducer TonB [Flavobacterium sp. MC2016-06]